MKLELPTGKAQSQARRKTSSLAPVVAVAIFLTIPLFYISIEYSSKQVYESSETSRLEAYNVEIDDDESCTVGFRLCREGEEGDQKRDTTAATEEPQRFKFDDDEEEEAMAIPERLEFDATKKLGKSTEFVTEQGTIIKKPENPEFGVSEQLENPKHDVEKEQPTNKNYDDHSRSNRQDNNNVNKKSRKRKKPTKKDDKNSIVQESKRMPGMPVMTFRGNYDRLMVRSRLLDDGQCDVFSGKWVPNPEGPYYTNETCFAIQEHQNCMKFGRPDREFLKWKWKPDDCELALFEPEKFLELVRGKSIAFVGDSVARNHMQSLICLLSRVANPVDVSNPLDQNQRYEYPNYDFNISMLWSPYLVRTELTVPNDEKRPFNLYLDEPNTHWTTKMAPFNYVIISAGHWFFRPTYFYINSHLAGCLYCPESNLTHLTAYFSYRRAFRTALQAINDAQGYHGVTFLRTFAPSHFEGAAWDKGGDCVRTRPYMREETAMEEYSGEMYLVQLEELRIAQKAGRRNGRRFVLFDATEAMQLRADGHPSKYGQWQTAENPKFANDCVHWCLPGPIDAWNDFLQELLRREIRG